jgi:phage terminase large subunit GpA-like protein
VLDILSTLKPPVLTPTREWVDEHIRYTRKVPTPWPGPFRIARTPHIAGVFDAYDSKYIEHIVLVWGRQTSKSTTVYCCMLHSMDQDPGPMIFNLPNVELAKYTSKNRIRPMINSCEIVRNKKTDNRHDFTTLEMNFDDMVLSLVGAGSDIQAMSRPCRYLFRDEIDEIDTPVLKMIYETTTSFANRKIVDTSTTTTEEGNVWQGLVTCQYVFEMWVPCPECGAKQILLFERIKFGDDHDPETVTTTAYYECPYCKSEIRNSEKLNMLTRGEWRARTTESPTNDIIKSIVPEYDQTISLYDVLRDPTVRKIGFYLPKWYAPMPGASFGQAAKEFLEATVLQKTTGNITGLKNWTKFWKSVPWQEKVENKTVHELMKNKVESPALVCPPDTVALTAGIDPGQGGYWYLIIAWRRKNGIIAPHLIDYGFITGKDRLRYLLFDTSYELQDHNIRLKIWRKGMDTGGSRYDKDDITMTAAAYEFIRQYDDGQFYGTKGMSDRKSSGKHIDIKWVDRFPGPTGKPIAGGLSLAFLDTDYFKGIIEMRLGMAGTDYGRFTLHQDTKQEFFDHITAEERRRDAKTRKWEWVKIRSGNHLLDCAVIAFAMADDECMGGIRVLADPVDDEPVVFVDEDKDKDWITGGNKRPWL